MEDVVAALAVAVALGVGAVLINKRRRSADDRSLDQAALLRSALADAVREPRT